MTPRGTLAYAGVEVPPLVGRAVNLALRLGFLHSCLPETGQLLRTLASGVVAGTIGETGTGCGVGLAWLLSGARPGTRLVSVELDAVRAAACQQLFAAHPEVTVLRGDAAALFDRGPFELLVLDGGPGSGKHGDEPIDPQRLLTPGGTLVIDDFAPMSAWPPVSPSGAEDVARRHWLEHPALFSTELTVGARFQPLSILVGRRRPPA